MPLHEFKTQVLLLHSEQTTLDTLSSGFSDNYTVHCATSGSEALNTLVETPINVIVTAQDLPGMSGLDALREAKKRSPDTIGILLAGNSGRDVQALVSEEEVFQVVSGNVTSDALIKLVENATRQMRLMALAESANDTVASVDEPAEHIVMETSDNGSTIISDGTGRMPALDPKKISAAASIGSRSVDILVLTKDQEFLETIKDSSRGMHKVYYANTLSQANEAIGKHKIGVAVVDAAMVGDKIEQLTQHLRKGSPRLVSIVAGRRDDGEMLMDLINRGKVYRFLLKPVSPGRARLAVESSVKHHLEAPDAAFKAKGVPAAAKPVARAAPKPTAKPAPVRAPKSTAAATPASKPAAEPRQATANAPVDPPLGSDAGTEGSSPIEDGLADAFGQDDTSFTETVTGLITSVSRKFTSGSDAAAAPEAPPSKDELDSSGGSLLQNPKLLGIGATAVVIVAGTLFWLMGGSDEPATAPLEELATPSITEADVVFSEQVPAVPEVDVEALIDEARLARDAGQIYNPAGSNAIELFGAALAADTENSVIAAELDAVIERALSMAESAMLDGRLDDTEAALQRVSEVDAGNVRLPFLTAQLSQMQLRGHLDSARAAIREDRYEDAANALGAARALGAGDVSEIEAVAEELNTARSEQQVDGVLAKAADRLDAGALLSPANDNARYYYELVLSNDAENTAARQGLSVIAAKLAFQARSEMDSGDLNAAEDTLADARAIDPANSEVDATVTALANTRAAIAERQRRVEAERVAEAARLAAAAEAEAEAERLAEIERRAAEAERLAAETLPDNSTTTTNDELPAAGGAAAGTLDALPPGGELAGAATGGDDLASAKPADNVLAVQRAAEPLVQQPVAQQPIAVSSLNRIRYVAPKYPRSAQRRNLSGWVDIVFTVSRDGTVAAIEVRSSEPGDTFVNAAVKAVEKWEFEPVVENGVAVEKRAGVRMMFALE